MRKVYFGNELYHHGVLGQKWGVRRYQNYDGTMIDTQQKTTKQKQDQNYKDISSDFSTVLKTLKENTIHLQKPLIHRIHLFENLPLQNQ